MAANVGALNVNITAVDKATGVINKVKSAIIGMNKPVGALDKSLRGIGRADFGHLGAAFSSLRSQAQGAAGALSGVSGPLGLITGAATLAGVVRLANAWGQFGTTMGVSAARMQTGVSTLHAMQGAARLAGGTAEALTQSFQGFREVMTDAAGGRNNEALGYLNMLGVSLRDGTGAINKGQAGFYRLADAIGRIADPNLQARVMRIFGISEDLWPVIRRGSGALRQYEAEARRFGVINEKAAAASREFSRAQTRLGMALEGVGNTIAEKVAPRITPLLNRTADWIADNKELASGYVTLASVIGITLLPAVSRLALSFAGIGSVLAAIKAFRVPVWLGTILGGAAVLGSIGATQGEAERNGERLSVLQAIKRWLEDRGVQFQIPSVRLPSALPPEVGRQVAAAAVRHGVNPDFATAIARNEGGTGRVSPAGAIGTMQLMPDTARDLGVNPYDQEQNIDGGVRYLRQLLNRFGGNQLAAAAAYNAGPNHPGVQRFAQTGDRSQLPSETKVYLSRLEAQGVRERGEVRVTVDLRNAPPGTIATAAATGSATVDRPRVATAMPGFAAP